MGQRFGRRASSRAKRGEAVRFRGEGIGEARIVDLQEYGSAGKRRAITAMNAAAAHRLGIDDAQMFQDCVQPEVRRVFARFRRSTRMPMKARSNLLRHEMLACSRSATRMRSTRDSAPAATV